MATHQHKNPCPRGHEIYNFGRPILGHHYYMYILNLSDPYPNEDKKRRNIAFSLYRHPQAQEPLPHGS